MTLLSAIPLKLRVGTLAVALAGGGMGSCEAVIRSEWLRAEIQSRMLSSIEQWTGSPVTVGNFEPGSDRLSYQISDLRIFGDLSAEEQPLLAVHEVSFKVAWSSALLGRPILTSLRLREPVLRVQSGETDFPTLSGLGEMQELEVRHLEIEGGEVSWGDNTHGVQFESDRLSVRTDIAPDAGRFKAELEVEEPRWSIGGRSVPSISTATLAVAIGPDGLVIERATIAGDEFSVFAQGTAADLASPHLEGTFAADVQSEAVGTWLGLDADAGPTGAAEVEGVWSWRPAISEVGYGGTIRGTDIGLPGMEATLAFDATFEGSAAELEVALDGGRLLDGSFTGSLTVASDDEGARQIDAEGSLSGLTLAAIVEAAGMAAQPWDATLETSFDLHSDASSGLEALLEVVLSPVGGAANLPLEGSGTLRYRHEEKVAVVEHLHLRSPNATVRAAGSVTLAGDVRLDLDAELASLQAVQRVLAVVQPQAGLPQNAPDGRYAYFGTLAMQGGATNSAALDGTFRIKDFEFGEQRWDLLTATGRLANRVISLREGALTDGEGSIRAVGTIPLDDEQALEVRATATRMDAAKVAAASGFGLPVDGALAMDVEVAGTLSSPDVTSVVRVDGPNLFGEPFDAFTATLDYGTAGFRLQQGLLAKGPSRLEAEAFVTPAEERFEFSVRSNEWELSRLTMIQLLVPELVGTVTFSLDGSGRLPRRLAPLRSIGLSGQWQVTGLQAEDLDLGHWSGSVQSESDSSTVQIAWEGGAFGGGVEGDAILILDEPAGYRGNIRFMDLAVGRIADALVDEFEDLQGGITGQGTFRGVAGTAGTFSMDGTVDSVEARFPSEEGAPTLGIANVFPLRWGVRDGALLFDSMNLRGTGADLELDGSIGLAAASDIDVSVDGTFNLAALSNFLGDLDAEGEAKLDIQFGGSLGEPSLDGTIELDGAAFGTPGDQFAFSDVRGDILVQDQRAQINGLTATSGGGIVRVDGTVAYGDEEFEYHFDCDVGGVRVNFTDDLSGVLDGNLTLAGIGMRSILNGNLVVERASTSDDLTFGEWFSATESIDLAQPAPFLEGMQLNLQVGSASQMAIDTNLVRDVEADLELDLVGTMVNPSVLGVITLVQGEIRMLGTHYSINRGDVRFVNPTRPEAVINIELETRIRDVDIDIILSGPSTEPNLSYRSDPPLPFHELVNLVIIGKEPTIDPSLATRRRIEQQSLVQTGADNLLNQAISAPVSQRLQRFFGVSRIKVDPQIGGLEANPGARISTEQQIADDLTLIYSYDLSSAQQQAIRIEWNPDRKWSLIVTRDQNGLVGSEVLYKVRLP